MKISGRYACALWVACLLAVPMGCVAQQKTQPPGAIYVGAWSVDHESDIVTEECLRVIRTKKILFGSRSWGFTIGSYIARMPDPALRPVWESPRSKRVNDNDMVLSADIFDTPKIVNFIFDAVPKRWRYMDDFLRKEPWKFGEKIDACFQSLYYSGDRENIEDSYFPLVDAWVRDFPHLKVAVFTHPISASGPDNQGREKPEASEWNVRGGDYSEKVIRTYYGKLPIFDMRDIVSTRADGTVCSFQKDGKTYRKLCREYNISGDLIHANSPEAVDRLGRGFLILLVKMFCPEKIPAGRVAPKPDILK